MTTTIEVANRLVELVKQGKGHEAMETLYAPDIVSVEAMPPPGQSAETRGIAAVRAKSEGWMKIHEIHGTTVAGPWPNGDKFVVRLTYDVTNRQTQQRFAMDEAALYVVRDGKIVHETFFYGR